MRKSPSIPDHGATCCHLGVRRPLCPWRAEGTAGQPMAVAAAPPGAAMTLPGDSTWVALLAGGGYRSHTHTHTHIDAHTSPLIHTSAHTHTHFLIHTHTHSDKYITHILTHNTNHTHSLINSHTHSQAHMYSHTVSHISEAGAPLS